MPVLKTFQGRPVTRVTKKGDRLQITFANANAGDRKQRALVTRTEWEEHGESRYVETMPDLRELANEAG